MKIHNLIKAAILDKELRGKLVKEPLQTCKDCGIFAQGLSITLCNVTAFSDLSIMQGGYRP
jgi:hypothetical protein